MNEAQVTDFWTIVTIFGVAVITVVTRAFFFLSDRAWTLPPWVERGLSFAPLAALAAVVVPEVVMSQGALVSTWQDARIIGALAGVAYFYAWRGILGTILAGMAVFLPLRLLLGW